MMGRRGREQRGDRHPVGRNGVGENDDVIAVAHRPLGAGADRLERRLHIVGTIGDIVGDVDGDGAERVGGHLADLADALELLIVEDRLRHLEAHVPRGALEIEQIGTRPDEGHERHHQLLADRIDRRVGDLGEVLLEAVSSSLGRSDRAEIGVSVPIEPTASWPVWAIGCISSLMSV